jgi:hypothetical protein
MSVINKRAAFDDLDTIDTLLELIKQLEATVLGLQQLRGYAGNGILEGSIEDGEAKIAEVKRTLIQ